MPTSARADVGIRPYVFDFRVVTHDNCKEVILCVFLLFIKTP